MSKTNRPIAALSLAAGLALVGAASADEQTIAKLQALGAADIAAIAADPAVIEAVKAQNATTAGLSAEQIDALDKTWRAEVEAAEKPTITPVIENAAAEALRAEVTAGGGLFTEIFVMDAVGLNVAASDVTSDYWQGDEAKWAETFPKGAGAVHVGEVELDESTGAYQSQVSVAVVDPASGAAIGAITVGVDIEYLP